jgi:serine O-acetyltransferase
MIIMRDLEQKCQNYFNEVTVKGMLRVVLSDGSSANVFYRLAQFFQRIHMGIIGWVFTDINKFLNGCLIGRSADFGPGFVLKHPIGVVINNGVKGGKNIIIESGVVIGAAHNGLPLKIPVLGDNISIGAGAKVLGGIRVGNNVKIGANAVVVHDVPDNATVVGIPAKVIKIG